MTSTSAVNLLWCVPGRRRRLRGVPRPPAARAGRATDGDRWRPVVYVPARLRRRPPGAGRVCPIVEAPIDGTSRPRRDRRRGHLAAPADRATPTSSTTAAAPCRRGRGPIVLTIHDLQYLTFPRVLHAGSSGTYLDRPMPRRVPPGRRSSPCRASTCAAPSSRRSASTRPASSSCPTASSRRWPTTSTPADELRRRYGLGDGPLVVYPAITHPHKGHRFLLDLLAAVDRPRPAPRAARRRAAPSERRRSASSTRLARVVPAGRVPAADRDGLIAVAEALVFPSEYEGFGAPVLEAMALGTPVVAATTTCSRRSSATPGSCVPLDLDAWAGALDAVAGDGAPSSSRAATGGPRCSPPRASGAALAGGLRDRAGAAR